MLAVCVPSDTRPSPRSLTGTRQRCGDVAEGLGADARNSRGWTPASHATHTPPSMTVSRLRDITQAQHTRTPVQVAGPAWTTEDSVHFKAAQELSRPLITGQCNPGMPDLLFKCMRYL